MGLGGVAHATSVTGVTAAVTPPSHAAGAKTVYAVGFTTSASGGLGLGGQITLTFPAGTNLTTYFTATVRDGVGASVGGCNNDVGQTITCFLFTGQAIDPNENVTVTINGITNPLTPGAQTLSVSTTADTTPVNSPTYSIVANSPISQPQVTVTSPSNAAGARTNYQVAFTTSATGALSQAAGSEILLTFPAGTNLTTYFTASVRDGTGTNVGGCNNDVGQTITCFLFTGQTIDANENVTVTINGITNPGTAGPRTLTVSTTSDPTTVTSATYTIVANSPISQPQVTVTSPSNAAGAKTNYQVAFTTSATGALSQAAGSEILLTFPAGTNLTTYFTSSVRDGTGTNVGGCNNDVGQTITCFLFTGQTIDANENVTSRSTASPTPAPPGHGR